jgi:hypothetical protein
VVLFLRNEFDKMGGGSVHLLEKTKLTKWSGGEGVVSFWRKQN